MPEIKKKTFKIIKMLIDFGKIRKDKDIPEHVKVYLTESKLCMYMYEKDEYEVLAYSVTDIYPIQATGYIPISNSNLDSDKIEEWLKSGIIRKRIDVNK